MVGADTGPEPDLNLDSQQKILPVREGFFSSYHWNFHRFGGISESNDSSE